MPSELSSASTSFRIFASGQARATRVARVVAFVAVSVAAVFSEAAASPVASPAAVAVSVPAAVSVAASFAVAEAASSAVSAVVRRLVREELGEVALLFLFLVASVFGLAARLDAVVLVVVVSAALVRTLLALRVGVVPVFISFVSAVRHVLK